MRRTRCNGGEAVTLWEETDKGTSTREASRGKGPGTYARIAEITSGRTISQQGLAITCKDPLYRETEGRGRVLVWRMSPYE
jgi:hypothetical protein